MRTGTRRARGARARVDLYQVTILSKPSSATMPNLPHEFTLPERLPLTWSKSRAVQVRAKVRATEHCGSTVQTGSRRDLVVISSWPVSSLDVWLSSPAHHYPCESEVPRARARAPRGSRPRVAAPRPRAVWDVKHVSFAQAPAACPHPRIPHVHRDSYRIR